MLLVPAIDLRAGRCVRLLQGSFSESISYSEDPVAAAKGFEQNGARWIHIVDLDAAEGKGADNLRVIERIRGAVSCALQAGGGVRSREKAARLIGLGIDRIVVGTVLIRSPGLVAEWAAGLGQIFAAGLDARDGRVRVAGWTEDADRADTEVAAGFSALGIRWLVYTNISRDGTLAGPDYARTASAARAAGLPTLLSGGIGSEAHIDQVAEQKDPGVVGIILGKALYESRLDLGKLFTRYPQNALSGWDAPAAS
jgi:phosphoribosylformimino-5-aminoimidazole carboxamide ribotide isomerase